MRLEPLVRVALPRARRLKTLESGACREIEHAPMRSDRNVCRRSRCDESERCEHSMARLRSARRPTVGRLRGPPPDSRFSRRRIPALRQCCQGRIHQLNTPVRSRPEYESVPATIRRVRCKSHRCKSRAVRLRTGATCSSEGVQEPGSPISVFPTNMRCMTAICPAVPEAQRATRVRPRRSRKETPWLRSRVGLRWPNRGSPISC